MSDKNDIDLSQYPRWSDFCIWRPSDDGIYILRIGESGERRTFQAVRLNYEGKDTWMRCTGENTIGDIIRILKEDYEGDEKIIQEDVLKMVRDLQKGEYLILEQSPNPARRQLDDRGCPRRIDDVIANVVEDNFVIMNMKTSEVHSFDKNVEYLWNICDGSRTIGEIISAAADADDILFLLQLLIRIDLLELRDRKTEA